MPELELSEIQGFVLRGSRAPLTTFFVLSVQDAKSARSALGRLVSGDPSEALAITSASHWGDQRPDYILNLGITWPGLLALGLSADEGSFRSFPAFLAGAAARAHLVGDRGESAPENWLSGLGQQKAHVVVSLACAGPEQLQRSVEALRGTLVRSGGFEELLCLHAGALPDGTSHFGYRDGLTQPNIEGAPGDVRPDAQPAVPACNFVLLDDPRATYYVPTPSELGRNGSFGVFRILKQDTAGFQRLLDTYQDQIDPELLAAKLLGRWRNGVALSQSPGSANTTIAEEERNNFDYVSSAVSPGSVDDTAGLRCPIGAHIRRVNPRGQRVLGGGGHLHRVIRRGVPFGPPYEPGVEDTHIRGLIGFFINAQIENQFEFIMDAWVHEGGFAAGLDPKARDPIASNDSTERSFFDIPMPPPRPPLRIASLGSFITTLGAAYCFIPSISGVRYLSQL